MQSGRGGRASLGGDWGSQQALEGASSAKGSVAPESGSGRKAAAQSWGAGAQEGWRDLLCLWQELTRARRVGLRVCTLTGLLEAGVGAGGWVLSPQSGELE